MVERALRRALNGRVHTWHPSPAERRPIHQNWPGGVAYGKKLPASSSLVAPLPAVPLVPSVVVLPRVM